MSPAMSCAAAGVTAILALPFAIHAVAYARAAAAKRRARSACPFEDDDHDTLPWPRALQLIVAESLLWWHAVLTSGRRMPRTPMGRASHVPVVVLPPPGLPRASVRSLAARLRADGFTVLCPRWSPWAHSRAERLQALDRALRTSWDETGVRAVDVIAPAGAAAIAAAHLVRGGSGVPAVRRLLAIGAPAAAGPIPPSTEVIALCSYDDPFLGPVEQARWPGATTVAIRGAGRLGLLHSPYVYELIREHLRAASPSGSSSWTSAAS